MPIYVVRKATAIDAAPGDPPEWWVIDSRELEDRPGGPIVSRFGSEAEASAEAALLNAEA